MTVRTDITVDWASSPRIITVAAPSVELTMQDLVDTCRTIEANLWNLDDEHLLDAAGKENLGGGVKVGITVTLNNARIAFEARLGPTYEQCNISGGNLVATDSVGANISPIEPTAFTQIVLANSSSATLSEQSAIQYSSYNGGVYYDSTSPYSGTDYPVGTPQQPVNNVYDAKLIAEERGFTVGYLLSDLTIPTDLVLEGYIFVGSGKDRTTISIPDLASIANCTYMDATVTGYLDGSNTLRDCNIVDLYYIKGYVEGCVLSAGTITLAGSEEAHFLDCYSGVVGGSTPVIDMGGSGQSLALRNYNGGIKLINKSGTDSVSIDFNSGQIIIDNTVTAGTIVLRGVGTWTNEDTYTGGATVVEQLLEGDYLHAIHRAHFNKRVWDKNLNIVTIYDSDGVTPLYVFDVNSDLSSITPQ